MSDFKTEFRAGWRNLLAATVGLAVGIPAYTPVSSLFLRALEQQFGWSKAVAAGASIAMPITALMLPVAGMLIDRIGVRIATAFSVVTSTICYLLLSRMQGQVGVYYAAIIALNLLGCATGPIGYTRLLATQFKVGRGTALAIAQFGIALIASFLPPILGASMAHAGWRSGYLLLAGLGLGGGILAQLLMKPVAVPKAVANSIPTPHLLASAAFWKLGFAILATSIATLGIVSQFQSLLIERGLAPGVAVWLLSMLAIAVMISRLFIGVLLDRGDPRWVSAAVSLISAVGVGILLATRGGLGTSMVSAVLIGLSIGAELDLLGFFCAKLFGIERYARNYGALATFFYTGIFIGGAGSGALHDHQGSYVPALGAAAGLLVVAALLFLSLPRDRVLDRA